MAGTTNISIRMDKDVKAQAEAFFSELGMNLTTAFNIFVRQSLREGKIPFEIRGDKPVVAEENEGLKAFRAIRNMAEAGAFPDMTLEEINEEIRKARNAK